MIKSNNYPDEQKDKNTTSWKFEFYTKIILTSTIRLLEDEKLQLNFAIESKNHQYICNTTITGWKLQLNVGHKSAQDPCKKDGWRAGRRKYKNTNCCGDDVFRDVCFPTLWVGRVASILQASDEGILLPSKVSTSWIILPKRKYCCFPQQSWIVCFCKGTKANVRRVHSLHCRGLKGHFDFKLLLFEISMENILEKIPS